MREARLALSVGCPCGIGPEVSVVAAARARGARVLLVGDYEAIARAGERRGIPRERLVRVESASATANLGRGKLAVWAPTAPLAARDRNLGKPTAGSGAAQLAWVDAACDLVTSGLADAMVTGPVSKDVIASSGGRTATAFLGHTEHLQRRLHAREVVMAFYNERFTTSLVTTHLPLARVPRAITKAAVARSAYWLGRFLVDIGAAPLPRIAVCGLNPHAGESGRLGHDETRAITPGIAEARARLRKSVHLEGPIPSETAFRKAANAGAYEGVVAMYPDQATIPMKLVGFGESVNVSLGLPIIRTSVDHGTGYDIASRSIADARGMREAIDLAVRMVNGARASRTRSSRG